MVGLLHLDSRLVEKGLVLHEIVVILGFNAGEGSNIRKIKTVSRFLDSDGEKWSEIGGKLTRQAASQRLSWAF